MAVQVSCDFDKLEYDISVELTKYAYFCVNNQEMILYLILECDVGVTRVRVDSRQQRQSIRTRLTVRYTSNKHLIRS